MDSNFLILELPYPNSKSTHTMYYKMINDIEIEVFNLPLSNSNEKLKELLEISFSIYDDIEEVKLTDKDSAIIKFINNKGLLNAISLTIENQKDLPFAFAGNFGINEFIERHKNNNPSIETLERISTDYIKKFEEMEKLKKEASGPSRHTIQLTEAEKQEMISKHLEKSKKMMSNDFYGFQQKGRTNLATALLSKNVIEPRHLKKKSKKDKKIEK